MLRHLMRALWRRRRKNGLIVAEIFVSFLVLFTILVSGARFAQLWLKPIGYEWENMWSVTFSSGGLDWDDKTAASVGRLLQAARDEAEVVDASALSSTPFVNSRWITTLERDGREDRSMIAYADDGYAELVNLNVVQGTWFGPEHDAQSWQPIVASRRLVENMFPGQDPIGQVLFDGDPETGRPQRRIVGVVEEYRQMGELQAPESYMFFRWAPAPTELASQISAFQIKVQPGTSSAFEERLLDRFRAIEPTWEYSISRWETNRSQMLREKLAPLMIGGLGGSALILMVALGLLGVLWQSVSARTVEFGLRRAVGASARRVYRQVTFELILLVTIGSIGGAIVAVQLPLLGVLSWVDWSSTWIGLGLTVVAMVGIAVACAAYPSWLAMRVNPAEALHYE